LIKSCRRAACNTTLPVICALVISADGARNPKYTGTFVFDNDYAALVPRAFALRINESNLIVAEGEAGNCRLACFSPRHHLTIPSMSLGELRAVVDMWATEFQTLVKLEWVRHVQIFENRGSLMGASNPHPHCQIEMLSSPQRDSTPETAAQRLKHVMGTLL
jgi:UDPglucose--hexose-1-phosphate uridylyltransferase